MEGSRLLLAPPPALLLPKDLVLLRGLAKATCVPRARPIPIAGIIAESRTGGGIYLLSLLLRDPVNAICVQCARLMLSQTT